MEYVGLIVFLVLLVIFIVLFLVLLGREYDVFLGADNKFYLRNAYSSFTIVEVMNSKVRINKYGKVITVSSNDISNFWVFGFVNREIGLKRFY